MLASGVKASKIWMNLAATRGGNVMKFIFTDLTEDRFEDFIDFSMKHFVAREFQHIISGLPKDPEGMAEYKEILRDVYRRPGYRTTVVYREEDNDRPDIISAATICLKTLQDTDYSMLQIKPQTKSLQRYFEIVNKWDQIFPSHEIMRRYGVEQIFDDIGGGVRPDYQRLGISRMILHVRSQICKEHGVPMTGSWMTSRGSEKAALSLGWRPAYEITSQQLEQVLGLTLPDSLPSFKYMVWGVK